MVKCFCKASKLINFLSLPKGFLSLPKGFLSLPKGFMSLPKGFMSLIFAMLVVVFSTVSCSGQTSTSNQRTKQEPNSGSSVRDEEEQVDRLFGGVFSFVTSSLLNSDDQLDVPGVNSLLWSASIDALKNLPVTRADVISGSIITDWITDETFPRHRYKLNIIITGKIFKLSSLEVRVFKEQLINNVWISQKTSVELKNKIENAILDKARNYYYIAKITSSLPQDR